MSAAALEVSPDLSLPLEAITETFAYLAMRRAGKTNAAVAAAEEMFYHGLPWVALDPVGSWWGIRATGDDGPGLPVLVFGGVHGDLPLEPGSGRMVADLIIDHNLTCVLDLTQMDDETELPQFVTAFLRRLFERNTDPRHVFFEEADVILPQSPAGREVQAMLRAGTKLIKLGGGRGLGCSVLTQRAATLNKNALAQIGTMIALRTTWPPDQAAIVDWMKSHSTKAEITDALPGLADGEAFVFSPHWLGPLIRIRFRRRKTYDSGATPKVGQAIRPPTDLASIDLAALRQAMAATIERAAADDPEALHARIRLLERQLADRPSGEPEQAGSDADRHTIETLRARTRALEQQAEAASRARTAAESRAARLQGALAGIRHTLLNHADTLTATAAKLESLDTDPPPAAAPAAAPAPRRPTRRPPADAPPADQAEPGGDVRLRAGAHRMVEALGRMYPLRLTKSQWGTVAKLKPSGGTWGAYMTDIRRAGFLDEDTAGAGYTLTAAGFDYLGGRPDPMTAAELQDHYRQILPRGAAVMLDALIRSYPQGLTHEQLGDAAGLAGRGGTFTGYVATLIRNGLAERTGDTITATSVLVRGAEAGQ